MAGSLEHMRSQLSDERLYTLTRLNACKDIVSKESTIFFLLREIFPRAEEERLMRFAETSSSSMSWTNVHDKILLMISSDVESSPPSPSGERLIRPSTEVEDKLELELFLRRSEAMVSRVLTGSVALKECHSIQNVDKIIEFVTPFENREQMRAFEAKKKYFEGRGINSVERLLFYPFRSPSATKRSSTDMIALPFLCEYPSVCAGFGDGLILCRALLGTKTEMSDVMGDVPASCDSIFVKPRTSKQSSQPGYIYKLKEVDQILPYSVIKLKREFAAIVLLKYLENADFFSGSAYSGVQNPGSHGTIPKTQQPPPKKSRGSRRKPFTGALAKHVAQLEVDEDNSDNCAICTFPLSDAGMYDDEQDDAGHGWAQLRDCAHIFHDACLREMMTKSDNFVQCPQCKKIYGNKIGTQPITATMIHRVINKSLPGERCDTIEIRYSVLPGIQGPEHPNPGRQFHCKGFPRVAYLPNDVKGQKVLRLLKRAFDQRLVFTVGTSTTSGLTDVVTWNDIHHKVFHSVDRETFGSLHLTSLLLTVLHKIVKKSSFDGVYFFVADSFDRRK